jgi:type I restriction enzyme R subunit
MDGQEYTEDNLNKLPSKVSIPEGVKDPRFRILIVSNKFQTGYDEPLIHSMFVDKKLNGVQCVQTLSRLNRTTSGKVDTFVLDFVNNTDDIVQSFQEYYTSTELVGETDPNKLYSLETEIKSFNLFTKYEVNEFCRIFYTEKLTDEDLQPVLNTVVDKWIEISDKEQKELFKSSIQSYIRLYGYISQIVTFEDLELEKLFIFLKFLNKILPKGNTTRIQISDSIDLESLRLQKMGEHKLSLESRKGELQPIGDGTKTVEEEELDLLSEIIKKMNEVYGIELSEEDQLNFIRFTKKINQNEELDKVMKGDNSHQNKIKKVEEIVKTVLLALINAVVLGVVA